MRVSTLKYVSTGKAVLRGKFTTLMDFQKIGKTKSKLHLIQEVRNRTTTTKTSSKYEEIIANKRQKLSFLVSHNPIENSKINV